MLPELLVFQLIPRLQAMLQADKKIELNTQKLKPLALEWRFEINFKFKIKQSEITITVKVSPLSHCSVMQSDGNRWKFDTFKEAILLT